MKQKIAKELGRNILLNPGPATTSKRVKSALLVSDICPREKSFGELTQAVRAKAVLAVNGTGHYEGVLLTCSGTGAIESCLSSCVDRGEGILIIENGAYGQRMAQICQALGIFAETLSFGAEGPIDLERVEKFLATEGQRFKVMAFIHHETTTGILNPLRELHALGKKYGLVTLVDAMSSYAGIEIDLQRTDVDYLISSSNKCIQGMAGIGIVVVKAQELERIKSFTNSSFYFDLYKNYYSLKELNQFLFTPPVQSLYALNEAFEEFFDEGGVRARAERYASLYEHMYNGMLELGFRPLLEKKYHSKILTAFFEPESENYSFDSMHDFLFSRGVTIYPGKVSRLNTFRISNIGDLRMGDIDIFLGYLKEYLVEKKIVFGR